MTVMMIDVQDAQSQLLKLLHLAMQGKDVVIIEKDESQVRLVPVRTMTRRRVAGLHKGAMRMTADFNEPLPTIL
jgi:antitoxin (DNA-binding transcriptional repressor) of toxin-antitoxin stability system